MCWDTSQDMTISVGSQTPLDIARKVYCSKTQKRQGSNIRFREAESSNQHCQMCVDMSTDFRLSMAKPSAQRGYLSTEGFGMVYWFPFGERQLVKAPPVTASTKQTCSMIVNCSP